MPVAIRSMFTTSVAVLGAGVIAVSPLTVAPEVHLPRVANAEISLVNDTTPALGAIPFQILVNQVSNVMALAPILIGSWEQCEVCLGPASPPSPSPIPFTGYGVLGIVVGLISSPVAFIESASGDGNLLTALGAAGLAIQTPITNTFLDLIAPRALGGFNLEATANRAFTALSDAAIGLLDIATQALFTGPIEVLAGAVSGAQQFVSILAATGDLGTALEIGYTTLRNSITSAAGDLVSAVQTTRTQVYNDLVASEPAVAAVPAAAAETVAETVAPPAAVRKTPRAAAAVVSPVSVNAETAVSQAARDTLGKPRAVRSSVDTAVQDGVGSAKRAKPSAARSAR